LIICGGMAFTFKKTLENVSVGLRSWSPSLPINPSQIGNSLFDPAGSEKVAGLVEKAKKKGVKLVLPVDYITGNKFDKEAQVHSLIVHQWSTPDCEFTGREGLRFRGHSGQLVGVGRRGKEPRIVPNHSFGGKDYSLERVSFISINCLSLH
jgi:hypothetical protein